MKRRNFIEVSLVAAASPVVASADGTGRLYGTPASVNPAGMPDPKLVLPLIDAGVPVPALNYLSQVSEIWRRALSDDAEMEAFVLDPHGYLQRAGLPDAEGVLQDENVKLLMAVGSPEIRVPLQAGDYTRVFSLLTASGVLQRLDPVALSRRLAGAFEERRADLIEALERLPDDVSSDELLECLVSEGGPSSSNDALIATTEIVRRLYGGADVTPSAVVPVVAIAIAAILVSVGISFTVATGAAIVTAAVAMTQVTVGGTRPRSSQLMRLDVVAQSNFERMLKLSSLAGDRELLAASVRELVEYEVDAIVDALIIAGLLDQDSRRGDILKDIITRYALNASGQPVMISG
ncbi:hypothetical protein ABD76_00200 [Paenibacillus dendritiformis]|nr:hypothetical protein [Paenibacillus dendritiformis]MBG9791043.1 hypothetical protein [Paenibacillus dendritiformis]